MPPDIGNLYLTRHGHREDFTGAVVNPDWMRTAACPLDPGLSALGHRQAAELGVRLRGTAITRVFCSPFLRTVQTAHAIAEDIGAPVLIEAGLSEWLNPNWYSEAPAWLAPEHLSRQYPRFDPTYQPFARRTYPEPDLVHDALPGVAAAVNGIVSRYPGDLLFVGHGASVLGTIWALGLTCTHGTVEVAALCHFRGREGAWEQLLDGCTAHLRERMEEPSGPNDHARDT